MSEGDTERTTYIDEDGIRIPKEVRDFGSQLVVRTPRSTIQHFGNNPMDPFYPMVSADDFGPADEFRDPKNPDLAPDRVSFKPAGEDAVTYTVHTEVER
jgi:hypothetical protein